MVSLVLLLSSCTSLNPLLYFQGESGDKTTLPVAVEELIEFAEYCNEVYENRNENYGVKKDEFSYNGIIFCVKSINDNRIGKINIIKP